MASKRSRLGRLQAKPLEPEQAEQAEVPEALVYSTHISEILPHTTSNGRFELALVPDPSFPECQLPVVVRSGEFCRGDAAFFVGVGAQIPKALSKASGWDGLLAETDYVVKQTYFGRRYLSNGLLLPSSVLRDFVGEEDLGDPERLTTALKVKAPPSAYRAHEFLLEIGFDGSCYHGSQSTGAEDERPTVLGQIMRCAERLGWVSGQQDDRATRSLWACLSRVDAGASARSFLLTTPPLINPETLECCPKLLKYS